MVSEPVMFPLRVFVCCLSLLPVLVSAGSLPREDGPVGFTADQLPEQPEWQELEAQLPEWPREERLIELQVNTGGAPFDTYIDPASISVGADSVVRYTSVLVSSSGVWNVTFEGLHCGDSSYRRFAYGAGERWHVLQEAGWQPLTTRGTGRYRFVLYNYFMCNPYESRKDAEGIIRALRNPPRRIGD